MLQGLDDPVVIHSMTSSKDPEIYLDPSNDIMAPFSAEPCMRLLHSDGRDPLRQSSREDTPVHERAGLWHAIIGHAQYLGAIDDICQCDMPILSVREVLVDLRLHHHRFPLTLTPTLYTTPAIWQSSLNVSFARHPDAPIAS